MMYRLHTLLFTGALLTAAASGHAQTFNYGVTLTANRIGDTLPIFGFTTLPAGPFTGNFSYEGELLPNQSSIPVTLTSFSISIGNTTWSLGSAAFVTSLFSTDPLGDLLTTGFQLEVSQNTPFSVIRINGAPAPSQPSWHAIDRSGPGWFCGFASGGPVSGTCVGGTPGSVSIYKVSVVPEPAAWLMTLVGLFSLAGIAAWRHQRSTQHLCTSRVERGDA